MDVYGKSYELLGKIASAQEGFGFRAVLLGGWAVYFYNPYMKSRDIDIAVRPGDLFRLRSFLLGEGFSETSGEHLGKKGFAMPYGEGKVDIDVYDKKIGDFPIAPVFERPKVHKLDSGEILVADETTLLALKVICAADRIGTSKGEKDISDIIALLDACLARVDFYLLEKHAGAGKAKSIMRNIFGRYETAKQFYPLSMEKFRKLRSALKKRGLL